MGGSRSHSAKKIGKSSQNEVLHLYISRQHSVFCLYTCILSNVSYYDLSALSMLVRGLKKSILNGWVGGVSSIQFVFGLLEFV